MKYIMGLDIGTTGSKATVFDENGVICVQAYREYPLMQYTGMIHPEMVWMAVQEVIRECTGYRPEIEAVCSTSFGETVVPLDKRREILGESILYTASGVEEEWKMLEEGVGAGRLAEITGLVSHPMYTISRLIWYKNREPERYAMTEKFLFFSGFINMKLCGVCAAEDTQAARSMAYDSRNRCWSEEILTAAGIDRSKLPCCVEAGEPLGKVSREVQRELGFVNAPMVIAGGHDQPCAALGMGAVKGGQAVYGLGTVECLSLVMDQYLQTEQMRRNNFVCTPHVVPGKYLTYGVLYSGGNVLKDLRNHFFYEEYMEEQRGRGDAYGSMFRKMPDDTELIFLPHLYGKGTPYMELQAQGALLGIRAGTGRGEVVLAALQGLAFDMRENIERLGECGLLIESIKAAGGGAKSHVAMQVRANALGQILHLAKDVQAGTKGAFWLAAKGLGWIRDFNEVKRSFLEEEVSVLPETSQKEKYEIKYGKYQKIKRLLADL